MDACSTLSSSLLEMLDVRVSFNIELEEKMTVSQTECGSWQNYLSSACRCSISSLGHVIEVVEGDDGFL